MANPTYNDIINRCLDEINRPDKLSPLGDLLVKEWILEACQALSDSCAIREERTLRLINAQEDYDFADTTTPVTGTGTVDCSGIDVTGNTTVGTGTVTTSGTTVTGSGTSFISQLAVGKGLIVGDEVETIKEIHSNTECVIDDAYDSDITTATAFSISDTKFTHEVVVGSIITIAGVTNQDGSLKQYTVDTITDSYNLTLTTPLSSARSDKAFTVDTMVTELPTKFTRVIQVQKTESGLVQDIDVVDPETFQRYQRGYTVTLQGYYAPRFVTVTRDKDGTDVFRIYPVTDTEKEIKVSALITVNPDNYSSAATTASIPLTMYWIRPIRAFVKSKMYEWMGDEKKSLLEMQKYEKFLKEQDDKLLAKPIRITVTEY